MSVSEDLQARYGKPARLPDDVDGRVLVFAHRDREAAEAFAAANREHFGHPSVAALREGAGWCTVTDLGPAIDAVVAWVD